MPSLADSQARVITCLQKGPAHFPDDLFAESRERALLGLKAHANTISHARLVTLEQAYPRLHEHIGHEAFHSLSRAYIEQDHVLACDINGIAAAFAAFIAGQGCDAGSVDLARIEWAWLQSYRSAEAEPLALGDIAGLVETELLAFPVTAHPAMRLVPLGGPLSAALPELAATDPAGLMITFPQAQVLFHPLNATEQAIATKIADCVTVGNLLDRALELGEEPSAMQQILMLVRAGALTRNEG